VWRRGSHNLDVTGVTRKGCIRRSRIITSSLTGGILTRSRAIYR
jgi:hypothetical protein